MLSMTRMLKRAFSVLSIHFREGDVARIRSTQKMPDEVPWSRS